MMNRERIRLAMLHIALICGIVVLTAGILDWFNPYMNFSGQMRPVEIVQVCDLLLLALTAKQREKPRSGGGGSRILKGR